MNFNWKYHLERQELLTSIIIEDTIESTFDNVKEWLIRCQPSNEELKALLNDLRIANMIRNNLYEHGVTK
jgi:hypothetical protein